MRNHRAGRALCGEYNYGRPPIFSRETKAKLKVEAEYNDLMLDSFSNETFKAAASEALKVQAEESGRNPYLQMPTIKRTTLHELFLDVLPEKASGRPQNMTRVRAREEVENALSLAVHLKVFEKLVPHLKFNTDEVSVEVGVKMGTRVPIRLAEGSKEKLRERHLQPAAQVRSQLKYRTLSFLTTISPVQLVHCCLRFEDSAFKELQMFMIHPWLSVALCPPRWDEQTVFRSFLMNGFLPQLARIKEQLLAPQVAVLVDLDCQYRAPDSDMKSVGSDSDSGSSQDSDYFPSSQLDLELEPIGLDDADLVERFNSDGESSSQPSDHFEDEQTFAVPKPLRSLFLLDGAIPQIRALMAASSSKAMRECGVETVKLSAAASETQAPLDISQAHHVIHKRFKSITIDKPGSPSGSMVGFIKYYVETSDMSAADKTVLRNVLSHTEDIVQEAYSRAIGGKGFDDGGIEPYNPVKIMTGWGPWELTSGADAKIILSYVCVCTVTYFNF